jgi:hypothetical protein
MYNYGKATCRTLSAIESSNGKVVKNSDGTVDVYYNNVKDSSIYNKSCCEILGFNFDIDSQKCYWSSIPNANQCSDCTTKVVYNAKDNDGTLFNVNDGETCSLDISLDYILNFDCDLFSKTCGNTDEQALINSYNTSISNLQSQINSKKTECETITKKLESATTLFNGLCYVIKGTKNTTNAGVTFVDDYVKPTRFNPAVTNGTNNTTPITTPIISPFFSPSTNTTNTSATNTVNNVNNAFNATPNVTDGIPTFFSADGAAVTSSGIPYLSHTTNVIDNIIPLGLHYKTIEFKAPTDVYNNVTTLSQNRNDVPPPFAWQWTSAYTRHTPTPINTTTSGPVSYCLSEKGLALWKTILGDTKYKQYTSTYGCDETSYTQSDFDKLIAQVNIEITKDQTLKTTDFITETTQGTCDKQTANQNMGKLMVASDTCSSDLASLINQLTLVTNDLNTLKTNSTTSTPISNLESLQIYLNLEVQNSDNTYSSVYEESIFNIGKGNLLNFILNESPNTGILISGATAGGILAPAFGFDLDNYATPYAMPVMDCNSSRTQFIKDLYLQQYKGVYPDPTTPEEELALNKKMNAWYNSSWLYYKKTIDETIVSQIKNKKIKISLRIENCCLDLCILTDNLTLTKSCESLHNQEIIISESPKFEIERVMDNRKSWVSYTENTGREHDLQFRETQYNIDDYRLSINTKEIDLKIDGANAIEEDVLCIIDCLISGDTGTTVTGTCCADKCDYGYVSDISNISNSFNNGKSNLGHTIKTPSYNSLDKWVYTDDYNYNASQGIWVPSYNKVNAHVWWDNSVIDKAEGVSSCDPEDYASTNIAWGDATLKAKNELILSTAPFDWANLDLITFPVKKYYLNRECSNTEFRIGDAGPGGYVAYVDGTGQHGLIYAYYGGYGSDPKKYWHATDSVLVSATGDTLYSGISNTTKIVTVYGSESNVAKFCSDYTSTGSDGTVYSDFYLPSKYELNLIAQNWAEIGVRLPDMVSYVWSSTENNASTAWAQNIYDGTQAIYNKSTLLDYIVVRKF